MSDKQGTTDRRAFLGLAAMTTTVTLCGSSAAAAPKDAAPEPRHAADDYRETDHIRAAYARMRF